MNATIVTIEEFHAHAIAIEETARERYLEMQAWFGERGEEALAALCASLAQAEAEHFAELVRASAHLRLPQIAPGAHCWLDAGPPEAPALDPMRQARRARELLAIALQAERRALAFYEWVARSSPDGAVRAAARELAAEERRHVDWVRNALEYHGATPVRGP